MAFRRFCFLLVHYTMASASAPIARITLFAPYAQVNLFRPGCSEFNLWGGCDADRGWVLCDGHLSIGIPDHDGLVAVSVHLDGATPVCNGPGRPRLIVEDTGLVVLAFDEDHALQLPAGTYDVFWRMAHADGGLDLDVTLRVTI